MVATPPVTTPLVATSQSPPQFSVLGMIIHDNPVEHESHILILIVILI